MGQRTSQSARIVALALGLLVAAPGAASGQQVDLDERDAPEGSDLYVEPDQLQAEPREGFELDRPLTIEVAFEHVWVARRGGGLVVAYRVSPNDWKVAKREEITLWMSIFIPNRTDPPTFAYSYHLPLEAPDGVLAYPRWLSTFGAAEVGLCALGTRPYDNLGLGRGYACEAIHLVEVHDAVRRDGYARTFDLVYYGAMPYYGYFPWRGPFL